MLLEFHVKMDDRTIVRRQLLYDGDCGFCQRWCEWAMRHGAEVSIEFKPCQLAQELRRLAGISDRECTKTALLIESGENDRIVTVRRGASAINGVLASLPGKRNVLWRLLSYLYRVPGIKQMEEIGYRIIARIRGHLSGGSCRMPAELKKEE